MNGRFKSMGDLVRYNSMTSRRKADELNGIIVLGSDTKVYTQRIAGSLVKILSDNNL